MHFTMNSSNRGALLQYGHLLVAVMATASSHILRRKLMPITAADIRREVKEKNVTFIRLMFSDILGTMKNVEILLQMNS